MNEVTPVVYYFVLKFLCLSFFLFPPLFGQEFRKIVIKIENHFNFSFDLEKELENQFLGLEISEKNLQAMQEALRAMLQKEGEFAFAINFPKQEITFGKVTLEVSSPTVSSISIHGNEWQSSNFYQNQLSLCIGEKFSSSALLNKISWLNRNPFSYREVMISPDTIKNGVDLEIFIKDRFQLRPFVGADNTGTNLTNEVRLFAGLSWGKAMGRSDIMTYQYTASPNPSRFFSHTLSYLLFLPWKHEINFYGGYSSVRPNIPNVSHHGISVQASVRYAAPFQPLFDPLKQTLNYGFDYKNLNSNIFYIEENPDTPIISHQATLFQLYFSYALQQSISLKIEALCSPLHFLPNQSKKRYQALRPHSQVQYLYGRLALAATHEIKRKFLFFWDFRAQAATGPLLPSEQFGLGGYDTIRGYKERDFPADNAFCLNLELRFPNLSLFRKDQLRFFAFTDLGYGYNFQNTVKDQTQQTLWSIGPGLRYNIATYLNIRADYGFQLLHIFGQNGLGRFHVGGTLSY